MIHSEPGTQVGTPNGTQWGNPKLRASCQACASSKVRCPKEKPSCSRCESRLILCEYSFTKRPGRRRADSTAGTKSPISSGSPCGYTSAANSTSGTVSGSVSASTPRSVPNPDVNWTWNGNTLHLLPPGSRSYARPEMITPSRMSNNDLNNPTSNLLADTMPVSNVPGMHSLLTDLDSNGLAYFTHGIGEMDFVTPAINSPIDSSMPVAGGDSGNAQLQINDASLLIPDDNTDHQGSSTGSDPHL